MILPNAKIVLDTGLDEKGEKVGTNGFTFKILGPSVGDDYASRTQIENPTFTVDYANNPFQSGITYLLTAEHPDKMPDPELVRIIFDENGNPTPPSPDEVKPGGLHAVCSISSVTTLETTTGGYRRFMKAFVSSIRGLAVWKEVNGEVESLEGISIDALKLLLQSGGQADTYAVGITTNTCGTFGGYIINQSNKDAIGKAKITFNNEYVADVVATAPNPLIAADFGLPPTALVMFSFAIPDKYLTNQVHTIQLRHITSNAVLGPAFQTPGNCGIQTAPVPTFRRRKHLEEKPAEAGVNPPPQVTNPLGGSNDTVAEGIGTLYLRFPDDEFTDTDYLTYRATGWDAANELPFPTGVTYDPTFNSGKGQIIIDGSVASGVSFVIRRSVTDTAGQPAAYVRLITVKRNSTPVEPTPYVVAKRIISERVELIEGGPYANCYVQEELNTGVTRLYTGGGAPSFDTPYPNGATPYGYNPSTGEHTWNIKIPADSMEGKDDALLTLRFTFPDKTSITLPIKAINTYQQANQSPVLVKPIQFLFANMGQVFSYEMGYDGHFSDPDGDALYYSLQISNDGGTTFTSVLPSWLTVNGNNYGGTHPVVTQSQVIYRLRITAADGKGGTAIDDYNLIVNNPTPPASVTKVAYNFTRNNPQQGQPSEANYYLVTDAGTLELATNVDNTGKSGYSSMNAGTYAGGYNRMINHYGLYPGAKVKLYIRQKGTTTDLLVLDFTCPNTNLGLTQIYPT